MPGADWQVSISERGREGDVRYRESGGELRCYWEFGGNDVIAIISVGREADWRDRHPWAAARRDLILSRIAAEVIHQRAPDARADLDESRGAVYVRRHDAAVPADERPLVPAAPLGNAGTIHEPAGFRPHRRSMMLALAVLAVALVAVLARSLLMIETTGAPWGPSARIGDTIISLITRLEPYVPSLHRNPGNDRHTVGLLLHSARDPSVRRVVPITAGQRASSLSLAKLTGPDGDIIRFQAPEPGGYDLRTGKLVDPGGIGSRPSRAATMADFVFGDDAILGMLTAGSFPAPDRWLGILSEADVAGSFKPGSSVSYDHPLQRSRDLRRLHASPVSRELDGKPRIQRLEPLGGDGMLNAAFVRDRPRGETLRLAGDGFLLVFESKPNRAGTLMVSRVSFDGKVIWTLDTGIGELREILPDPATPALIGDRPRIPDKVPEPILVIVDAVAGGLSTRSLWVR